VNLLILEAEEAGVLLRPEDRRTVHVRRVLGKKVGDEIVAGILFDEPFAPAPGCLGRARIERLDEKGMILSYIPLSEAPPLRPLRLILGFPRPIQGGRLLKDLASLGISDIVLCGTELGEKSYLESDLWKKREYLQAALEGAEQAASPRLPRIRREWSVKAALAGIAEDGREPEGRPDTEPRWAAGTRLCLHPGEGLPRLGDTDPAVPPTLAVGSERGWTDAEVAAFAEAGFLLTSLGDRILKTETAAIAASSIVLSRTGFL